MGELDNLLLTYSRSKFGPLDSVYLMLWKIKGFLYALNGVSMDYTLWSTYSSSSPMWSIRLEGRKRLADLVDQLTLERCHSFWFDGSCWFTNPILSHHMRRWHIIKSPFMRCIHPALPQRLHSIYNAGSLLRQHSANTTHQTEICYGQNVWALIRGRIRLIEI